MLGESNPYSQLYEPKKWYAWYLQNAAKTLEEKSKRELKKSQDNLKAARVVKKRVQADQGIDEPKTNPLVIAAVVIGVGALLYIIMKKAR